jgi:ATP-binding cassette subfamily F protein 3
VRCPCHFRLNMLFRLSAVNKTYAGHEILHDVSFQINPGEKVGLVGRNGAGKTTIFRLLTGVESPDEGEVIKISNLKMGLLEQHVHFEPGMTVHSFAISAFQKLNEIEMEMRRLEWQMAHSTKDLENIYERYSDLQHEFEHGGGFEATAKAEAVLLGLNFPKDTWSQDVAHLSGGQQNRLGLAKLLLTDADLLLLDEPTNHLDINSVEWLEEFLKTYDKAFVIISHDRYFLDRTTTRTIEIDDGRNYGSPGNYSQYVEIREERREAQRRTYENQQALIAKTEDFIRRNIAGQKTKLAKSRRNMLERMDRIVSVKGDRSGGNFNLNSVARAGGEVLVTDELTVGYENTALLKDLTMTVRRGDSLGIIGGNGSGKTTLIKTVLGKIQGLSGTYRWGSKTNIGYYSQHLEDLDPRNEIINELRRVAESTVTDGALRGYLAKFLFVGDDVYKRVGDLSGGEKGRLALAKLIYSRVNVLVLDEPTNHLDIPSREALEDSLIEYDGTIIVISHDRFFLDKIAEQILALGKNARYDLFDGNYSEYHEWKGRQVEDETIEVEIAPVKDEKPKASNKSKNEQIKLEKKAAESEKEIARLEGRLKELTTQMSDPKISGSAEKLGKVSAEYQQTEKTMNELFAEWEETLKLLS